MRDDADLVIVAQLTTADMPDVVTIHLSAFAGYMNASLGPHYVAKFVDWFRRARDGIALVGRIEGKAVGYVVGAPVGYQRRLNRDLMGTVGLALAQRPWLLMRRDVLRALIGRLQVVVGRDATGVETEELIPREAVSLVGIGVSPDARGKGVGGALMRGFEDVSRSRGAAAMRLSVYRDNLAARKLYESSGWWLDDAGDGRTVYFWKMIEGNPGGGG